MGHCKVRICHLTLAPGVLTQRSGEAEEEDQDLEVECILAHEHLQQVMHLSVVASSARWVWPHVHGVDSIVGRFWASNISSESGDENEDMIDGLVTSLGHLSIDSSAKPSAALLGHEESISSMLVHYQEVASHSRVSREAVVSWHSTPEPRPWKGPLPAPRSSLRLTIGDAIANAKILHTSPGSCSSMERGGWWFR
jgi:hypothetical protein